MAIASDEASDEEYLGESDVRSLVGLLHLQGIGLENFGKLCIIHQILPKFPLPIFFPHSIHIINGVEVKVLALGPGLYQSRSLA